ncbi:hypothetical protein GALMADRAFT_220878 [Galerina marginata CBS 339.88]|uniref:Mid2 domain-containing protein n=1 Tax=Galerina marginata (strain CBS 339.88) TaxID=685588 RepID=A0A067TKL8_GALM3|nr:hypothetical protein GALMADRAFT_220878 [Galerina marginata CBS 339.88]
MLLLAGLLLLVFALGALVAPANALKFTFTDVQQCDPVMISFSGSNLTGSNPPTALTILPINSTAISIPLPDPTLISSGIALTFLPFIAGSNFLASLDNSTGENLIDVSDLIRVLPSPNGNSSCIPPLTTETKKLYTMVNDIVQCEEMSITYDKSLVSNPPIVRLYNPQGPSFLLNMTSNNSTAGVAKYLLNFSRGKEILLLMEDGSGIRETSPLVTVGGDASSDSSCLKKNSSSKSTTKTSTRMADASGNPGLSRPVIIGSATGGSVVLLIALCMVVFIVRERRRTRKEQNYDFDPTRMEKQPEDEKRSVRDVRSPPLATSPSGTVTNPIYTSNSFLSPTKSNYARASMASWAQVIPEDQKYPASPVSPSRIVVHSPRSFGRMSLESLDIEGMLNMATLQSEVTASRKNSEATILAHVVPSPSATLAVPTQTFLRPDASLRHQRNPSNVPMGFDSLAFERYSANPFDGRTSITPSLLQDSLRPSRPTGSVLGLPTSPRNGGPARGKVISVASSSDWYGIAR